MTKNRAKERRAHPRTRASFALQVSRKGDALVAAAENLSRSGIMCALPKPLDAMTRVQISLRLPPVGTGPHEGEQEIRTEGVIVRSQEAGKGRYDTAIFFPELSEESALSIDRFIKSQSGKSRS